MKILQESDFAFHPPFSPSRRIVAFLTDSLILIAVILLFRSAPAYFLVRRK